MYEVDVGLEKSLFCLNCEVIIKMIYFYLFFMLKFKRGVIINVGFGVVGILFFYFFYVVYVGVKG